MDNNETNTTPETVKSRRSFIKKSSIAAGISIIPASNVWGACNVSGVSGGSQTVNTTCLVAAFGGGGGLSPDRWKLFLDSSPSEAEMTQVATILSNMDESAVFDSGQKRAEYYYPILRSFIFGKTITIIGNGDGTGLIRDKTIDVGIAIANNSTSLESHIACTYLNGLFEWNTGLSHEFSGLDGNRLFVDHIWGSAEVNGASNVITVLNGAYRGDRQTTELDFKSVLGI